MAAGAAAATIDLQRESGVSEFVLMRILVAGVASFVGAEVLADSSQSATTLVGHVTARVTDQAAVLFVGALDRKASPSLVVKYLVGNLREGRGAVAGRAGAVFDAVENLELVEEAEMGIGVAAFTSVRGAVEFAWADLRRKLMADVAVGIQMAAGQHEGRLSMHVGVEVIWIEVMPVMAGDATIGLVGSVIELPRVWILVAASALIGSSSRIAIDEVDGIISVALRTRGLVVRVIQDEARLGMLDGAHLECLIPKAGVLGRMATNA